MMIVRKEFVSGTAFAFYCSSIIIFCLFLSATMDEYYKYILKNKDNSTDVPAEDGL